MKANHIVALCACTLTFAVSTVSCSNDTGRSTPNPHTTISLPLPALPPPSPSRFTELDDFTTGWAIAAGSIGAFSAVADTDYIKTGTSSARLSVGTGVAGSWSQGWYKKNVALNLLDADGNPPRSFLIKAFVHNSQATDAGFDLEIWFVSSPGNRLEVNMVGQGGKFGAADQMGRGWNNFVATDQDGAQWAVTGNPDFSKITSLEIFLGLGATYVGPNPYIITFDSLSYSHSIKSNVGILSITMDDSDAVQYDICKRLKDRYGFKATLYNIADRIDTGGLTSAQLVELHNDGHDIQLHGGGLSFGGENFAVQPDNGAQELQNMIDKLAALGITPPTLHMAYPDGVVNPAILSVLQSKGIATARVIPGVMYSGVFPIVDQTNQYLQGQQITEGEVANPYRLNTASIISVGTDASGLTYINRLALERGGWAMTITHGWPFGGLANDPNHAAFDAFFDQIKAWQDAGLIEVLTVSEVWDRIGKPAP